MKISLLTCFTFLLSNLLFAQTKLTAPRPQLLNKEHTKSHKANRSQFVDPRENKISSANSVICLYDSIYQYTWDTISNNWDLTYLSYFKYDANGHTVGDSMKQWNGLWMENIYADNYYYTGNNLTLSYQYSWNGSAWDYSWKTVNTFSGNNVLSSLQQTWNASGYWENSDLDIETYVSGNLATDTAKYWSGSSWVNYSLITNQYNGSDLISELVQNWNGSSWDNSQRVLRSFSSNGLSYMLYENWNTTSWDSSFQVFYNSGGGQVIDELFQNRDNNTWVNSESASFYYCSNTPCVTSLLQKEWANNTWRNHYKFIYYGCNSISGIKPINVSEEKLTIYPNPANGIVTIESSEELQQVTCFNSLGEVLFKADNNSSKNQFDLRTIPSGIYLIQVKTKSGSTVKKIILNN
jgi:hypothetical protein